jgi:hypothetical protein
MWGHGMQRRNHYEQFIRDILAETKDATKEFRVDGAKEFRGATMKQLSTDFRFKLNKTARYVHEHAGKVERSHQTVDRMAMAMMNTAQLPHDLFWSLSGNAAIHVKNRMPTKGNEGEASPYEKRYGVKPDTSHLKIFGCTAYVYKSKETGRKKLENSGKKAMFVGYAQDGPGYLVMDLETLKISTEGIVDFIETEFPGRNIDWTTCTGDDSDDDYYKDIDGGYDSEDEEKIESDNSDEDEENLPTTNDEDEDRHTNEEEQDTDDDEEEANAEDQNKDSDGSNPAEAEEPDARRRSGRKRRAPDRYGVYVTKTYTTRIDQRKKMNYKQALASPNREHYQRAIIEYLRDLLDTSAIEIVPRPNNVNTIGSRWVSYQKFEIDRNYLKTKVRWTPYGFQQQKGIDFAETFAPVAISSSNRMIYVWQPDGSAKKRRDM